MDIECSCNALFASSATQQVIAQVCNDATRLAYHSADFIKNTLLDINQTGTLIHGIIKVKPTEGGDFGDFVNAVTAHWNKTFSGGTISFQFTQVGITYFGTDALSVDMDSVLPGTIEKGSATRGGRELVYTSTATTSDIAHEFGHILGFRDTYIVLPTGFGQDLPCHTGDIMATSSSGKAVRTYHASLLVAKY